MDHRGSAHVLLDESKVVVASRLFNAFGETVSETGTWPDEVPFGYQSNWLALDGMTLPDGTRLYLSPTRIYHPGVGRFLQRDWVRLANRYAFVSGNPTRYVDRLGLYGDEVHAVLTDELLENIGVDETTRAEIARHNVASDNLLTFLFDGGPAAHALAYGLAPLLRSFDTPEAREKARKAWEAFVQSKMKSAAEKIKKCDCSGLKDLGRLLHSVQDRPYHGFRSWIGWHGDIFRNYLGGQKRPASVYEEELDQLARVAGLRGVADQLAQYPQWVQEAVAGATRATVNTMNELLRRVGDGDLNEGMKRWRAMEEKCGRGQREEEQQRRQAQERMERQRIRDEYIRQDFERAGLPAKLGLGGGQMSPEEMLEYMRAMAIY